MAKTGTFVSVAENQEGKLPEIVTPSRPLPVDSTAFSVARGLVPGAEPFGSYGERSAAGGEVNRVVWPNGVFSLPPAPGVQMSIVSTSANDSLLGTGARTLEVHYLDAALNPQHETVELDGLTPVLTSATDVRFIQCMHLATFGSLGYADGTISASNGGSTYSQIAAGDVRCSSSARMIPAGKACYVAGSAAGSVSGTSSAKAIIRLVASELDNHQYIEPLMLIPHGSIACQDISVTYNFPVPLKFTAGTVVALTATVDKDATIAGSWFGWIEDA